LRPEREGGRERERERENKRKDEIEKDREKALYIYRWTERLLGIPTYVALGTLFSRWLDVTPCFTP